MFARQIAKAYPDDDGRFNSSCAPNTLSSSETRRLINNIRRMMGRRPLRWYEGRI